MILAPKDVQEVDGLENVEPPLASGLLEARLDQDGYPTQSRQADGEIPQNVLLHVGLVPRPKHASREEVPILGDITSLQGRLQPLAATRASDGAD